MKTKFELTLNKLEIRADDEYLYVVSLESSFSLKVKTAYIKKSFKELLKLAEDIKKIKHPASL